MSDLAGRLDGLTAEEQIALARIIFWRHPRNVKTIKTLTNTQLLLHRTLKAMGEASGNDIAEKVSMNPNNIRTQLSAMFQQGYITRESNNERIYIYRVVNL